MSLITSPELPFTILAGQLYVGPHQEPGTLPLFDVVVGVAKERRINAWDHPNATVLHVPMVDDGPPSDEDRARAQGTADYVDRTIRTRSGLFLRVAGRGIAQNPKVYRSICARWSYGN